MKSTVVSFIFKFDNGLESTNKWIKDCETLRNRLSLSEFNNVALKCVANWSEERGSIDKSFVMEPLLDTRLFTLAFKFA